MNKPENWGYEHPEVVGPNALMFFTWDLSKTIEIAFKEADPENIEQYLNVAQSSIDALLQKYVELKAAPDIFEGQSIKLRVDRTDSGEGLLIALQTSEALEEKIIAMQNRTQAGHS
ncbi:hypothetical protein V757_01325 [Pelistega indica]|uniref:Uncharacterized protein n=1 Tax=Pelistega indica TaxID=1414851 RepID=V8GB24_9BURK|nr:MULTISPECIES: hypothetical protein [Pelistega]ETD72942.1 hypothetical protein V757_01325 [Pelistega indica]